MKHTHGDLKQMQSMPLEAKIRMSINRIKAFYEYMDGHVYVSFSGGKDSTVLLHLVRSVYPEVKAVFVDTGLEFPEIKRFARSVENVEVLRPKMPFKQVIEKYGYPVISKEVSMGLDRLRNTKSDLQKKLRLHGGVNPTSNKKQARSIPIKYHFLAKAPFKISERCCDVMKKQPIKKYESINMGKPFIGTMASDSHARKKIWLRNGCNSFSEGKEKSTPMSFWLDSDVWAYIKKFSLEYATVYDLGYERTGCVFCMFGMHLEKEDRFERLAKTHPKLHKYCIENLGLKEVLAYFKLFS